MDALDLLHDLQSRLTPLVRSTLDGLDRSLLVARPAEGANTIAWLLWHQARVADAQVSERLSTEQVWLEPGLASRFGLAADPSDTGFGHGPEEVGAVRPDGTDVVLMYTEAVGERVDEYTQTIDADHLDEVIDRSWDPPVTLGVRLVSIAGDRLQHVGQAAYARGLLEG